MMIRLVKIAAECHGTPGRSGNGSAGVTSHLSQSDCAIFLPAFVAVEAMRRKTSEFTGLIWQHDKNPFQNCVEYFDGNLAHPHVAGTLDIVSIARRVTVPLH